jgi:hypothetical protein
MTPTRFLFLFALLALCFSITRAAEQPPLDISDSALTKFIATPFQYDYTKIVDDHSLREFIDALDRRIAIVEYRQRYEYVNPDVGSDSDNRFGKDLEKVYRDLMSDSYLADQLVAWKEKTTDPVNLAFIEEYLRRRTELMADQQIIYKARQLSQRIADRLYHYSFRVDDSVYSAEQAAEIIASGDNFELADRLYKQQNDSAANLAMDATRLYLLYQQMGEFKGFPDMLHYNLSGMGLRVPEWFQIADKIVHVTQPAYDSLLDDLRAESNLDNLPLFFIEQKLETDASLEDSYFTADKIDTAIQRLLKASGFLDLYDRLSLKALDSGQIPALAVGLYPPSDVWLMTSGRNGFEYYRRLVTELGRASGWVYAEPTLPYVLRGYPYGCSETVASLFEDLALSPEMLSSVFGIPDAQIDEFTRARRRLELFQLRQITAYFLFDYYLTEGVQSDPQALYQTLEESVLGSTDKSERWIEVLITGEIQRYTTRFVERFAFYRLLENLTARYGDLLSGSGEFGGYLYEKIFHPGKTVTVGDLFGPLKSASADLESLSSRFSSVP